MWCGWDPRDVVWLGPQRCGVAGTPSAKGAGCKTHPKSRFFVDKEGRCFISDLLHHPVWYYAGFNEALAVVGVSRFP